MKKVIKGRLCDTETAKKIGEWNDLVKKNKQTRYVNKQTLYLTRSGQYFIHFLVRSGQDCGGNMRSRYAKSVDMGDWESGQDILVVSINLAQEWAKEHLTAEEYTAHFEISEDEEKVPVTVRLKPSSKAKLDALKSKTGRPVSELVDEWLQSL